MFQTLLMLAVVAGASDCRETANVMRSEKLRNAGGVHAELADSRETVAYGQWDRQFRY